MSVRPVPDMELLLSHSAWVRSLARRLVGEESRVDDVVQETWLAALAAGKVAAPRAEVRSIRGWLAGILANRARENRRGEARRRAREERAAREARSPVEPSAGDAFEAVSTGRELAGMVLELEEPFRTAVLLRYYEDLPPRRIAKRLGIPVRTVNSRLSSGLERLRERWRVRERAAGRDDVADDGAWSRSLLALAGHVPTLATSGAAGAAGVALPIGVALMNAKIWLGAALLGAGAMAWWLGSPRTESRRELPLGQRSEPAGPAVHSEAPEPMQPAVPGPERRSAAAAAPMPANTASADTRLLRGRVLDAEARPRSGVEVGCDAWNERDLGERILSATSGPDGVFELVVPRGGGELRALDPALVTVMRGRVSANTGVEPLVVVAPRIELAGVVLDQAGAPLGRASIHLELPRGFGARFEAVFDATECGEWRAMSDERGRFGLGAVPSIAGSSLVAELPGYRSWRGEVPWRGERDLTLTLERSTAEVPAIVGRVVDAEHSPVAGAWVSLGGSSTATDAAGEFRLERDDALEALELRALKSGHRLARLVADADEMGRPVWPDYAVLVLGGPPLALGGRVVDARGAARAGMRVWLADPTPFGVLMDGMDASAEFYLADSAEEGWSGDAYWSTRDTDADGRFRIDGLLERDYTLRILNPRTLEILTAGPFRAGEGSAEVVFADGELGRVAGRLVARDGRALAGVTVSILGRTFGGVWSYAATVLSDTEGRFAFDGIGGEELKLSVSGDDVVPEWSPVVVERGKETVVELTVSVRCTFQLDLGLQPERADSLCVLDEDGARLALFRIGPTGSYRGEEFPIVEGRSESLGVEDRAHTLVLQKGGVEALRLSLELRPGKLNLITP